MNLLHIHPPHRFASLPQPQPRRLNDLLYSASSLDFLSTPTKFKKKQFFSWDVSIHSLRIASRRCHPKIFASPSSVGNTNDSSISEKPFLQPLPDSVEESVLQAVTACKKAISDGKVRLQIDLLLPLIGATDLDDWPGGIQQQYIAAYPLVLMFLQGICSENNISINSAKNAFTGKTGSLNAENFEKQFSKIVLDDGDAVVKWENEKICLILFPTAEVYDEIQSSSAAKNSSRPILLVNPQWQSGQVISDFGFGPWGKKKEEFLKSFEFVYSLKRLRIDSKDVRILKSYPGQWQIFSVDNASGNTPCIASEEELPTYKQIQQILRSQNPTNASQSWFDRLKTEFVFNKDSMSK